MIVTADGLMLPLLPIVIVAESVGVVDGGVVDGGVVDVGGVGLVGVLPPPPPPQATAAAATSSAVASAIEIELRISRISSKG